MENGGDFENPLVVQFERFVIFYDVQVHDLVWIW